MASKKPLYQRTWFIVTMSLLLIGIVGGALNGGDSANDLPLAAPTATETVTVTATPSPTETPSASASSSASPSSSSSASPTTSKADSASNKAYFTSSAKGDLADLEKDITDAIKRTKADQKFRLMGNILEFSFNLGQLQALDAPSQVSAKWEKALTALETAITASSEAASSFVAGDAKSGSVLSALDKVQSKVDALYSIVALVK